MARSALTYCPHCGQPIILSAGTTARTSETGWTQRGTLQSSHRFGSEAAPVELPMGDWQKVTPVARLTPTDVTTSIYDAAVSGILVSLAALGVCWWIEQPLIIAPAAGVSVTLWRYFGGLSLAKGLLEIVETVTHQDAPHHQDQRQASQPKPIPLEITQKSENGTFQRMFRFHLPDDITEKMFYDWAADTIKHNDLTQARWVSRRKFSRDQYINLLEILETARLVRRLGDAKNATHKLTPEGKTTLRYYVEHTHSLISDSFETE